MWALVRFPSSNSPIYFTSQQIVSVPRMSYLGKVMVLRNGQYVPMWNEPELTDLDTLTFHFMKPETGLIY